MRKSISLALGVALALTVLVAVPASAAPAGDADPVGGPCGMPGMVAGNVEFGGIGTLTHLLQNKNHVIMTCKGTGIANDSGRTQRLTGFPCGVPLGDEKWAMAEDSRATITKTGRANTTCKVTLGDD